MMKNFLAIGVIFAGLLIPVNSMVAEAKPARHNETIYVSPQGSDSNPGTRTRPWRSLRPLEHTALPAGSTIRLKRNMRMTGSVAVTTNDLTISSYGRGSKPLFTRGCLTIIGKNITVSNIKLSNCREQGVLVTGDNAVLTNLTVTKNSMGIIVGRTARGAVVAKSRFVKNNRMVRNTLCSENVPQNCDDDYGASAISVQGSYTVVKNNYFSGNFAKSLDYGTDGSSVEIFGADHTLVKNNVAKEEFAFTELGGTKPKAYETIYLSNRMESSRPKASFLITRGEGVVWGPVKNTKAYNNRAYLTGSESVAFSCAPGCHPSILTMEHNSLAAVGAGWVEGSMYSNANAYCGEWTNGLDASSSDQVQTLAVSSLTVKELKKICLYDYSDYGTH